MAKIQKKPLKVFFVHIPKCGGTSVAHALKTALQPTGNSFLIDSQPSRRASNACGLNMMSVREAVLAYNLSLPKNSFGSGHVPCKPALLSEFEQDWDFITLLRNPVDRWISQFVYDTRKTNTKWARNTLPLAEFLATEKAHISGTSYLRFFSELGAPGNQSESSLSQSIDQAVSTITRLKLVGILEALDTWSGEFELRFGRRLDIGSERSSPDPSLKQQIYDNTEALGKIEYLCRADMIVYQRVCHYLKSSQLL